MLPAVAVKFALFAEADTVTDAGTVSVPTLLDSPTVAPPTGAAFDNVTVHVDAAPFPKLLGVHATRPTTGNATSEMDAVCVLPFNEAVTTAA